MANRHLLAQKAWRALTSLPFLMVLGFWVSYLLFGYFAINPIAQRLLPWVAENKLASRLQVERVDYDPLRIALTVNQLQLTTPEGVSLAGFERLHADLELSGLFRLAWRLKDIQLSAPHVSVEVLPGGESNWAKLIAKLNENPDEEKSEGMTRLLVDHILIERGDIEYMDHNRPEPFRAVLEPLGLELDGFSTLPEDLGDYAILAKLPEQGGTLKWKGELGLNPMVSSGKVELEGLKLAKLLEVLPPEALPVKLEAGLLRTRLDYQFALVEDKPEATIRNFSLALDEAAATLLQSQAQQGKVALKQLAVELPSLQFRMNDQAQMQFDALKLVLDGLKLAQDDKPLLDLPAVTVADVALDLQARKLDIGSFSIEQGEVKAVRQRDGSVNWQQLHIAPEQPEQQPAEVEPDAEAAVDTETPWSIHLNQARIDGLKLDYQDETFKRPLQVAADKLSLNLAFASEQGNSRVESLQGSIGPFSVRSGANGKPVARLESLVLQGGQVDLAARQAGLEALVLKGLSADVLRDAKQVNWQAILEPAQSSTSQKTQPKTARAEPGTGEAPWAFDLKRFAIEDAGLHFRDQSANSPVALDIENANLEVKDVSLDTKRALPVSLAFRAKQGGSFNASGKLAPAPMQGDIKVKLAGFSLKPFAPYVNQFAMLKLNSGAVSTQGDLNLKQGQKLAMQYKGGFSVDKLDIVEEDTGQAFLGWRSFSTNSLRLGLAPDSLRIGELKISEPRGKFIIYEDRTLNVKRILREQPADAQAQAVPSPVAAQPAAQAAELFPVAIERIRIDNANLEFADLSLTPQFGTHINSLSGVINGMSTNPSTTAQVELDGKVDDYGSARIRGSVQPFQATEFTDLKLVFRNLEMNRLTPYSGKFAGRRIDSGKLSVDLEYKIKNRQLAGENKFIVNKLRLGERVESEDAVNLPLDLAIALLEDSSGVIDLDLPVSGSLDDPEFSYGKIVWKAVVNVLSKLVTSPFRALGNLLGISSEALEALVFDPGSAELAPPEQEKLKVISEALAKRPALILQVAPVIDEQADGRALQEQLVRNQVAAKMGIKLQPGEKPGPIDTSNKKARSALDKLAKEQLPPDMLDAIKAKKKEDKDEAAYYIALLDALNKQAKIEASSLEALGNARQEAVQRYLLETLALDPGKLQLMPLNRQSTDGGEVKMPLELGTARKAE
ncbi:DUF748 domain-containing protein [Methylobacillus flagellatus]|uniref:DUF748 domain-containing protein n=1 Tax=Methylobacillus flagellatus (strain ATCC 51484 / DSM 6875 / VKM B-1610 / KT) TaxID=265072 RepID=Q1H1L3_METFK|nr:DUF748 domain-containing protein [Methylobacillus flagellatus]ABE49624.1 protein of unknown function DUF748 [Methylobacillus flagellatus KT]